MTNPKSKNFDILPANESLKRCLEIALAGNHNVLVVGTWDMEADEMGECTVIFGINILEIIHTQPFLAGALITIMFCCCCTIFLAYYQICNMLRKIKKVDIFLEAVSYGLCPAISFILVVSIGGTFFSWLFYYDTVTISFFGFLKLSIIPGIVCGIPTFIRYIKDPIGFEERLKEEERLAREAAEPW